MKNYTEGFADRLLKVWTAKGIVIRKELAYFVEVEVQRLVLNPLELSRAISSNMNFIIKHNYPPEAFKEGITLEELVEINEKRNRELQIARNEMSLAAAVLAHGMAPSQMDFGPHGLDNYVRTWLLAPPMSEADPAQAEFLFVTGKTIPTIYTASEALSAVTRYTGPHFLSVRLTDEEFQAQVRDELKGLQQNNPLLLPPETDADDQINHNNSDES